MAFFSNRRNADESSERDEKPLRSMTPPQPIGFETVLGASNVMEGKLISKGNVRLDGEFNGSLDITGNILVGETAKITADIEARNISIAGSVRGNVTGNKVQILRTGRIWGDIKARALTMEEGAFVDGKISMQEHTATQTQPVVEIVDTPELEEATDKSDEAVDESETIATMDDTISDSDDETITAEDRDD